MKTPFVIGSIVALACSTAACLMLAYASTSEFAMGCGSVALFCYAGTVMLKVSRSSP